MLTLLEILEIYWKFTVFWKFSGLVCEFARLSSVRPTNLVFQSVSVQYKISRGKPGSTDSEVSNLD